MKFILVALVLTLAGPGLVACGKYKMVNVDEDEKAKTEEAEKMAMELKEKLEKESAAKVAEEVAKKAEEMAKEAEEAAKKASDEMALKEADEEAKTEAEKDEERDEKIKELEEKLTELTDKKDDKTKVVVIRDKTPSSSGTTKAKPAAKPKGWIRLYDDKGFTDRQLTVGFGHNIGNFHYVSSDDGKSGFNDKASAVKFSVPSGWKAVLYENSNYSKRGYPLKGRGSIADLGYFGDKASSIRWERN